MQTAQLNTTIAEKVLLVVKNVDGSGSMTTGQGVCLVQAGASIDGIGAVRMTAGTIKGFCGIATQDIAINSFGNVQAWGYVASVWLSGVGSSITITRGDTLIPGAVAGSFFSSLTDQAISTLLYRYAYAATTTVAISTNPTYVDAVVKGL